MSIQVLCFVSAFTGDLIPPEAVMKLRQKHPGTVRVAESDEGSVVQDSPLILVADRQSSISSHLPALCAGGGGRKPAATVIFTSTHEVHSILQHSVHNVDDVAKPYPAYSDLERCSSVSPLSGGGVACQCSRLVEFYWYPCALKYCRNQDSVSSLHIISYHQIRGFLFAKSAFQALYFSALFLSKKTPKC